MLASIDWSAVALLAFLVLAGALLGLTVSGHFPLAYRSETMRASAATAFLWVAVAVVAADFALAVAVTWSAIPLAVAVIVAGGILLVAPLLLQLAPDHFVDGRQGLVAISLAGIAAALLAVRLLA
jgi:hypothetical protein